MQFSFHILCAFLLYLSWLAFSCEYIIFLCSSGLFTDAIVFPDGFFKPPPQEKSFLALKSP